MSKLPTAESIPKPIGDMLLNVPHVITQNGAYYHYSDVCSAIESHTAALRKRIVELESGETELQELFELRVSVKNLEAENKQLRKILEKINNIVNGTGN